MEEEATQATQSQAQDPRRMGRNNSGLNDEDIADLICILHPCSPAAFRIVAHTANRSPRNVLQAHGYDNYNDGVSQAVLEEQETFILQTSRSAGSAQAMDLALRFSANVIRPHLGFVFGRSVQACDVVLDTDTVKRVSNVHFRIYLNDSGVLMLEDVSTNGTIVDDVVLRSKAGVQTRMLTAGAIIQIISPKPEEVIKFIVRIPNRDDHHEEYKANVERLLQQMATAEFEAQQQAGGQEIAKRLRPAAGTTPAASHRIPVSMSRFGMHWSGGDRYNVVGHIGKGAFAMVYQLATKNDGQIFAAKELEKRRFMKNGVLDRKIDNELQIMKAISHQNVVRYVEYQDIGQYLYIIMEFVPCGDLQGYLTNWGALTEPLAKKMSEQVFDALDYLHRKKITHRDIKPDNILLADLNPATFTIKLSDFGLSKVVKNDETFLKTFCGTLLYCAPEVFPQYDTHSPRHGQKRGRRGTKMTPQKFHSYSQSVDIWSYGAVLWFSLCLEPPFEGVADANGDGMFNKIMMTPLDTTQLTRKHVSPYAITLLLEMLNTDPAARPTPAYCLNHSWFGKNMPTVAGAAPSFAEGGLDAIAEEHEQPSFARLSIAEPGQDSGSQTSEVDLSSGDYKFFDPRKSKRFKSEVFAPRNSDGSPIASSPEAMFERMPSANNNNASQQAITSAPNPKLFGEISQSAYESSGALAAAANQNQFSDSERSTGSSDGDNFREDNAKRVGPSPSLLGAESLVRDMHMEDSRYHSASSFGEANEPTTPNSPAKPQSSLPEEQTPVENTPKPANQPTFSRQIRLEISPSFFYDTNDPSTHNVEYASKVSGYDFTAQPSYVVSEKSLAGKSDQQPKSHDSVTREGVTQDSANDEDDEQKQTEATLQNAETHKLDTSSTAKTPDQTPSQAPTEFLKPPPRAGKLTSTPDSFTPKGPITLNLNSRLTTWGRAPSNTQVYPDPTDTRIGKRALLLWFHAKGIDAIPEGDDAWTRLPDLHCVIATESSAGLWVNGVHLKRGEEGRRLFGRVYDGDEVVVWKERGRELKFRAEFGVGEGKGGRPGGGERFVVEMEGGKGREA